MNIVSKDSSYFIDYQGDLNNHPSILLFSDFWEVKEKPEICSKFIFKISGVDSINTWFLSLPVQDRAEVQSDVESIKTALLNGDKELASYLLSVIDQNSLPVQDFCQKLSIYINNYEVE